MDAQFWNSRYKEDGFAYGDEPNAYFKSIIDSKPPGRILLPAEGEGRNAVYAARLGWEVVAYDIAEEGKQKALQLANLNSVSIQYLIGDVDDFGLELESFDAVALIYAHFSAEEKIQILEKLPKYLKKGAEVWMEAFGKKHIQYKENNPAVGGPGQLDVLYSIEELVSVFEGFSLITAEEVEVELSEGKYHRGIGSAVHFIARK